MPTEFEDKYLDVLHNLESAIVDVYHEHPDLTDYDVDKVLNTLLMEYKAGQQNRQNPAPAFTPLRQQVYERVKGMCEWRLGRVDAVKSEGGYIIKPDAIQLDEMMACLKRIRKSVEKWTREGGRQGYLHFVEQFLP